MPPGWGGWRTDCRSGCRASSSLRPWVTEAGRWGQWLHWKSGLTIGSSTLGGGSLSRESEISPPNLGQIHLCLGSKMKRLMCEKKTTTSMPFIFGLAYKNISNAWYALFLTTHNIVSRQNRFICTYLHDCFFTSKSRARVVTLILKKCEICFCGFARVNKKTCTKLNCRIDQQSQRQTRPGRRRRVRRVGQTWDRKGIH